MPGTKLDESLSDKAFLDRQTSESHLATLWSLWSWSSYIFIATGKLAVIRAIWKIVQVGTKVLSCLHPANQINLAGIKNRKSRNDLRYVGSAQISSWMQLSNTCRKVKGKCIWLCVKENCSTWLTGLSDPRRSVGLLAGVGTDRVGCFPLCYFSGEQNVFLALTTIWNL